MQLSTDRILTTHVGSLPRPKDVEALLLLRERNEAYDHAALREAIAGAVAGIVRRQAEIGIDVVSDGETSKVAYSTYIHDRLSGFDSGHHPRVPSLDIAPYAEFREKMARMTGSAISGAACVGPIAVHDTDR